VQPAPPRSPAARRAAEPGSPARLKVAALTRSALESVTQEVAGVAPGFNRGLWHSVVGSLARPICACTTSATWRRASRRSPPDRDAPGRQSLTRRAIKGMVTPSGHHPPMVARALGSAPRRHLHADLPRPPRRTDGSREGRPGRKFPPPLLGAKIFHRAQPLLRD
jgi:hypothetical protein